MSNKNEVYIIEDIHPGDAYYDKLNELVGKRISKKAEIHGWEKGTLRYGWVYVYGAGVPYRNGTIDTFYAVKLTTTTLPKKSFWQKLFTWSW